MKYLLLIIPILLLSLNAKEIAIAQNVKGVVQSSYASKVVDVKNGDWIQEKSTITTGKKSGVTMIFKDNSVLVLGANSSLVLIKHMFEPSIKTYDFKLRLNKGLASFESGKIGKLSPEDFTFMTPDAEVEIRGTKFIVKVQ